MLFSLVRIIEEKHSPINGKLTVVKDVAWGIYIKGGGLTQSGGVAEKVWRTSLKKVRKQEKNINTILILGLGGGGIAKIARKLWPKTKIDGVDIDPVIVDLGKKYLDLDKTNTKIIIGDAYKYCKDSIKKKKKYDLICIDMYVKDEVPERFRKEGFIKLVKKMMTKKGAVVVNRLFYNEKRKVALVFRNKLEKSFLNIETVFPEANIMFICRN